MSEKDRPWVRVEFPLTQAAFEPTDISRYQGISFDVRGEAAARILVQGYAIRNADQWAATKPKEQS